MIKIKSFFRNLFFYISGCVRISKELKSSDEDDDVAIERQRIYSDPNNTSKDVLRMVDLVKVKIKTEIKQKENFEFCRFMDQHLVQTLPLLNKLV